MEALSAAEAVGSAGRSGCAAGRMSAAGGAPAADASAPAIEARGCSFSYPGGSLVLDRLDWRVPAGAFHLLVGSTGSGKTTLLRSCKPEIAPAGEREGVLRVFGAPLAEWSVGDSAAGIGYVAQNPENQLVCDSVWHELAFGLENLGMPPEAMRRRVAEAAHFFGIEPWMRRAAADLSGGQKQMVNLAAVLALRPRLLLLDEPTAQLDPVAEKNFLHALFRINRELGLTVVVATHSPEAMVDYATGCTCLVRGRTQAVELDELRAGWVAEEALAPASAPAPTPASAPAPEPVRSAPGRASGDAHAETAARAAHPLERPVVEVRDAHFRYAKDAGWVLRGLDFAVRPGRVHAVVGGNGCGKSTLLRVIAGVLPLERGRVLNACADAQALMPQDPKALFVCDTVLDELREWRERCGYGDGDVDAAARRFGLQQLLGRHPYDLSGGQQQKLAFAKVLLTNPSLLLLDEPTKGLDAPSQCEVADALLACAAEGRTVVAVTHDLAFASLVADDVTLLFDGEAACTEPASRFFAENLFYRPAESGFARLFASRRAAGSERNAS